MNLTHDEAGQVVHPPLDVFVSFVRCGTGETRSLKYSRIASTVCATGDLELCRVYTRTSDSGVPGTGRCSVAALRTLYRSSADLRLNVIPTLQAIQCFESEHSIWRFVSLCQQCERSITEQAGDNEYVADIWVC